MQFSPPLTFGTLERRYKRFLADVVLDNGLHVTTHCANTGAMTGLCRPGLRVALSRSTSPTRKTAFSWELVQAEETWVSINTSRANALIAEALQNGHITPLAGYHHCQREVVTEPGSRLDFYLSQGREKSCFVEVKSVTLTHGRQARFPDAITQRGTRHLTVLERALNRGCRAMFLFLALREDCESFSPATDIDPVYSQKLGAAISLGVEALAMYCHVTPQEIHVAGELPMELLFQ